MTHSSHSLHHVSRMIFFFLVLFGAPLQNANASSSTQLDVSQQYPATEEGNQALLKAVTEIQDSPTDHDLALMDELYDRLQTKAFTLDPTDEFYISKFYYEQAKSLLNKPDGQKDPMRAAQYYLLSSRYKYRPTSWTGNSAHQNYKKAMAQIPLEQRKKLITLYQNKMRGDNQRAQKPYDTKIYYGLFKYVDKSHYQEILPLYLSSATPEDKEFIKKCAIKAKKAHYLGCAGRCYLILHQLGDPDAQKNFEELANDYCRIKSNWSSSEKYSRTAARDLYPVLLEESKNNPALDKMLKRLLSEDYFAEGALDYLTQKEDPDSLEKALEFYKIHKDHIHKAPKEFIEHLQTLADAGDRKACINIGNLCRYDDDSSITVKYFVKALELGTKIAKDLLIFHLDNGARRFSKDQIIAFLPYCFQAIDLGASDILTVLRKNSKYNKFLFSEWLKYYIQKGDDDSLEKAFEHCLTYRSFDDDRPHQEAFAPLIKAFDDKLEKGDATAEANKLLKFMLLALSYEETDTKQAKKYWDQAEKIGGLIFHQYAAKMHLGDHTFMGHKPSIIEACYHYKEIEKEVPKDAQKILDDIISSARSTDSFDAVDKALLQGFVSYQTYLTLSKECTKRGAGGRGFAYFKHAIEYCAEAYKLAGNAEEKKVTQLAMYRILNPTTHYLHESDITQLYQNVLSVLESVRGDAGCKGLVSEKNYLELCEGAEQYDVLVQHHIRGAHTDEVHRNAHMKKVWDFLSTDYSFDEEENAIAGDSLLVLEEEANAGNPYAAHTLGLKSLNMPQQEISYHLQAARLGHPDGALDAYKCFLRARKEEMSRILIKSALKSLLAYYHELEAGGDRTLGDRFINLYAYLGHNNPENAQKAQRYYSTMISTFLQKAEGDREAYEKAVQFEASYFPKKQTPETRIFSDRALEGFVSPLFDYHLTQAENDSLEAQKAVIKSYLHGRGVQRNIIEAGKSCLAYLKNLGDSQNIGNNWILSIHNNVSDEEDVSLIPFYKKAASLGFNNALLAIGNIYNNTESDVYDLDKVCDYLEQAFYAGNEEAIDHLIHLYTNNKNLSAPRYEKTFAYFKEHKLSDELNEFFRIYCKTCCEYYCYISHNEEEYSEEDDHRSDERVVFSSDEDPDLSIDEKAEPKEKPAGQSVFSHEALSYLQAYDAFVRKQKDPLIIDHVKVKTVLQQSALGKDIKAIDDGVQALIGFNLPEWLQKPGFLMKNIRLHVNLPGFLEEIELYDGDNYISLGIEEVAAAKKMYEIYTNYMKNRTPIQDVLTIYREVLGKNKMKLLTLSSYLVADDESDEGAHHHKLKTLIASCKNLENEKDRLESYIKVMDDLPELVDATSRAREDIFFDEEHYGLMKQ